MKFRSNTINNLFYLVGRKRKLTIIFTVSIIVSAVLEAAGIGSLYPIIGLLEDESKKAMYLSKFNALFNLDMATHQFILTLFVVVGAIFLARGLVFLISIHLKFRLAEMLKVRLQSNIFSNYLDQEYNFFVKHRTGDLIQRQMTHTENAGQAVLHSCQLARNFLVFLLLYVMIWVLSVNAAIIISFGMILLGMVSVAFAKMKIYLLSLEHAEVQKEIFSLATEVLTGIRQVKAFAGEDFFKKKFLSGVLRKAKIVIKNNSLAQAASPTVQTVVLLGVVFALFYAVFYSGNLKGFIPMFGVLAAAVYRISVSLSALYGDVMQLAHFLPSVDIVAELDRMVPEEKDLSDIKSFERSIKLDNVFFSYHGKGFELSNINLEFERGRFYGIVGRSGSGKSSLVDLIIKFYQPLEGCVLIDDRSLVELDARSWRRRVGLVSQDTFIFNGSVLDNIAFAQISSEVERNRAVKAAETADIHDFIRSLPEGYNTEVGERGLTLSGGQRQRLAIARAICLDPDLFIFDEATSSLDSHSEKKIQTAIENLSKTSTVIAIAHRISTVMNADKIFVMDSGNIVEEGSHEELVKAGGVYEQLYLKQHPDRKSVPNDEEKGTRYA